jgi:probable rRNA maturation factor
MLIDITIEFAAWSKVPGLENLIKTSARAAVSGREEEFKNRAELSILLTSDEAIRQLNSNFRGQDKPTNVLSFGGETETVSTVPSFLLGDVVLSYQTIAKEAQQQGKSFDDHVSHLIVHGVLHLLGYDHDNDELAHKMERVEIKILKGIGVENPYSQEH